MRPVRLDVLVVLAVLGGLVASGATRAEDAAPAALSLRQAIERAVAGNIDLRKQNVALRAAAANVVAAEGQFDVVLNADANLTHNVIPPLRAGDPAAGSTTTPVLDLGLSRALETGGNVSLLALGRRIKSTSYATCFGA